MPKFNTDFICGYAYRVLEKAFYEAMSLQVSRIDAFGVVGEITIPNEWIVGRPILNRDITSDELALTQIKSGLTELVPHMFVCRSNESVDLTIISKPGPSRCHTTFRVTVKRKEAPRDMTVEQIENILGFKINIIE